MSKMGAAKANSLCKNFDVSSLSGQFQERGVLEPASLAGKPIAKMAISVGISCLNTVTK